MTLYVNNVCVITVWLTPLEVDVNAMERHATTHTTKMPWRKALSLRGLSRPLRGFSRPLRGLSSPLRRLSRTLRGLSRSLRGLSRPLRVSPGLSVGSPGLSEGFEGPGRTNRRTDRRTDRLMDGQTNKRTDRRTDRRNFSPFYTTMSPTGANAQKWKKWQIMAFCCKNGSF